MKMSPDIKTPSLKEIATIFPSFRGVINFFLAHNPKKLIRETKNKKRETENKIGTRTEVPPNSF